MQHEQPTQESPDVPQEEGGALPASSPEGPLRRLWSRVAGGGARRVIARNAAWNWASFVLHAVVLFFLSPWVVRGLGNDLYGYWEAVLQLMGVMGFADFGIRPAIVHYIAKSDALKSQAEVNRFVNSAFTMLAIGGVAVIGVVVASAPFVAGWFGVPAGLESETILATLIVGVLYGVYLPLNAFSAVLIGKQRFDLSCRMDMIALLLRAGAFVLVLAMGWGLVGIACAHAGSSLFELAWKTRVAFKIEPRLRFRPRLTKWSRTKKLVTFGALNLVVAASIRLTYQVDALVVGLGISLWWVAIFAFGGKLAAYTRDMLFSVGRVLVPAIGAIGATEGRSSKTLATLVTTGGRNMLALAMPLFVYWWVFGGGFLETWLGDAEFRQGHGVLRILVIGSLFPVAAYPIQALHYGTNRMRSLAVFAGIEGASNLALSLALVGPFGIEGVAFGTAAPAFVVQGLLMPSYMAGQLSLSLPRYFLSVWTVPLLAGSGTAALALTFVDPETVMGWPTLIVGGMLVVLVYAALAFGAMRLLRPARLDEGVFRGDASIPDPDGAMPGGAMPDGAMPDRATPDAPRVPEETGP